MSPSSLLVLLLLSVLSFGRSPARADAGPDTGADALTRHDYDEARRLSGEFIASGTHTATELAPAYDVLARASAQLGDTEAARAAFTILLALKPSYRLSSDHPVEVRSPYLEARGSWSGFDEPLGVRTRITDGGATLVVEVDDPMTLSTRIRVRVRVPHSNRFLERVQATHEPVYMSLASLAEAGSLLYSVALLDEHGNRIYVRGSDEQPEQLATRPAGVAAQEHSPPLLPRPPSRGFQIGGLLALAVGTLATAGGVVANLKREQLAGTWNRANCVGTGVTRGERCADERQRITTTQRVAAASYAVGAAGVLAGIVLLLKNAAHARDATPSRAKPLALDCHAGPALLGVGCALEF